MIFLTGDTHIPYDIRKLNTEKFPEQKDLTRDDFVIVLGDFGLLWSRNKTFLHWKQWLDEKPFTTLWLDGNHENFDWLERFPVSEWHGGNVHFISNHIIHLMRGQVFDLANRKFFVCGGATSIDKGRRATHVSWWPQEDISYAECNEAIGNLEKVDYEVDYILTHTCPSSILEPMFGFDVFPDPTARFLDEVKERVPDCPWYFGHHHEDIDYDRFHCLYQTIVRLEGVG